MEINRRSVLRWMSAFAATTVWTRAAWAKSVRADPEPSSAHQKQSGILRRIATEEAFTIPELTTPMKEVLARGGSNLDLTLLRTIYADSPASSATPGTSATGANRDALARMLLPQLLDIDSGRIGDMNASSVDMQVLSLFMPGVQLFSRDTAVALARVANDRLSDAIRRHPTRFAGLASLAPQDPRAAATEMERAIKTLKLNGFIVNSPPCVSASTSSGLTASCGRSTIRSNRWGPPSNSWNRPHYRTRSEQRSPT